MNRRRMILFFIGIIPKVEVPNFDSEDLYRLLEQEPKSVTELKAINKEVISPKEYGLKKLGTKKYKEGC